MALLCARLPRHATSMPADSPSMCRTEPQPEAAAADNTIAEQALCRCSSLLGERRCPILLPWCGLPPVILTISSLLVPNQSSAVPLSAAWSTGRTRPSSPCSMPSRSTGLHCSTPTGLHQRARRQRSHRQSTPCTAHVPPPPSLC
jgi:hypothetical protein